MVHVVVVGQGVVFAGQLDGFAVLGREGAQGMLHLEAELPEDVAGNVSRILGNEEQADALRADKLDDGLQLVQQRVGGLLEDEVSLVDENHQFRSV